MQHYLAKQQTVRIALIFIPTYRPDEVCQDVEMEATESLKISLMASVKHFHKQ